MNGTTIMNWKDCLRGRRLWKEIVPKDITGVFYLTPEQLLEEFKKRDADIYITELIEELQSLFDDDEYHFEWADKWAMQRVVHINEAWPRLRDMSIGKIEWDQDEWAEWFGWTAAQHIANL